MFVKCKFCGIINKKGSECHDEDGDLIEVVILSDVEIALREQELHEHMKTIMDKDDEDPF